MIEPHDVAGFDRGLRVWVVCDEAIKAPNRGAVAIEVDFEYEADLFFCEARRTVEELRQVVGAGQRDVVAKTYRVPFR